VGAVAGGVFSSNAILKKVSFASVVSSLQGSVIHLPNGASCTIIGDLCSVGEGQDKLLLLPEGVSPHIPIAETASYTVAITGLVTSVGEVLTWTLVVILF